MVSGSPFAGAWAGTGFGYTSAPTVAQMAASLSATPQPFTVSSLTSTGAIVGVTGTITDTSTSDTAALTVSAASDTSGVNVKLIGNGSTTPNKWIRVFNGAFNIINSGYSGTIFQLSDAGDLVVPNIDASQIGAITPSPGYFTTLNSSGAFTPSGGIVGNTSGTAAPAGYVGEVLSNQATAGIAAGVISPLTGVTLSAGSWYCSGSTQYISLSSAAALVESFFYLSGAQIPGTETTLNYNTGIVSNYTQLPTGAYFTTISTAESLYVGAYANVSASSVQGYISCLRVR
jgi:hypothetical protein